MLQLPSLFVCVLLALLYAALFQLWKGRNIRDLLFNVVAALAGVACGQAIGARLHLIPLLVGQVRIVEVTIGAWVLLLVANWIRPRVEKQ